MNNEQCTKEETINKMYTILINHVDDKERHVEGVHKELALMRENHLAHIQSASETQAKSQIEIERRLGVMNVITQETATNQSWLVRYHWIVASSSIGALITSLLALIFK